MSERRNNESNTLNYGSSHKQFQRTLETSPNMFKGLGVGSGLKNNIREFEISIGSRGRAGSPRGGEGLSHILYTASHRADIDLLEIDEKCPYHSKEQHIAVEEDSGTFGCNKCVFEKRIQNPLFISVFARTIKKKFDEMYELLLRNMMSVDDFTPAQMSQRIQATVTDFFGGIAKQLKDLEKEILQQVKQSNKLKELAKVMENVHDQFDLDEDLLEKLRIEKGIIEDKVQKARFGYIVTRKEYYRQLVFEMQQLNDKLNAQIESTNSVFTDLLQINPDQAVMMDKLYDLIQSCVKVDHSSIKKPQQQSSSLPVQVVSKKNQKGDVEEEKKQGSPSPFKTPKEKLTFQQQEASQISNNSQADMSFNLSETSQMNPEVSAKAKTPSPDNSEEEPQLVNEFFTIKDNDVYVHKFNERSSKKIYRIEYCHLPKLAFTQQARIFLIGGAKDSHQTKLINTLNEIVLGKSNVVSLVEKSPMKTPRIGFGCLVDNYGENIYTTGGSTGNYQPSAACEVYSVPANKWTAMPNLCEPKLSASLCMFNDEWLYSFGGINKEFTTTSKIERLNIKSKSNQLWESLSTKLPKGLSSAGAFQVSMKEMVIFGGWNHENLSKAYLMTQQSQLNFKFDPIGDLRHSDIFLFTGALRQDVDKGEVAICGQEYIHTYKEKSRKFEVGMALQ